ARQRRRGRRRLGRHAPAVVAARAHDESGQRLLAGGVRAVPVEDAYFRALRRRRLAARPRRRLAAHPDRGQAGRAGHAGAVSPRPGRARRRAARHVTDDVRAAVLAARAVLLGEVRVERDALRARRRIGAELAARVAIDGAVRRLAEALSVTLLGRVFDDTVPAHSLVRRRGGGRDRTTRATAR